VSLSLSQSNALTAVRERARASAWTRDLLEVVGRTGESASIVDLLRARLWQRARVALQFHPDRLLASGETVAEGLLRTGVYRNQFETGISNGSRTAFPGGERDRWEHRLFDSAYAGAAPHERPKYGALHVMDHADGPSPRFGSCYLVLRPEVTERCTFTWGDSYVQPTYVGTSDAFDGVLTAWLERAEASGDALLVRQDARAVIRMLTTSDSTDLSPERAQLGRALDDYVEAQVHGAVRLPIDVTRLVIDPSFDATDTGRTMTTIGERFGIEVRRHPGYVLDVAEVPHDFRGPRMPAFAKRVAEQFSSNLGRIDAAAIGRAAADHHRRPESWADRDSKDETLQHLKQLWHVTVHAGRPAASAEP
jgi:hypothetical protein